MIERFVVLKRMRFGESKALSVTQNCRPCNTLLSYATIPWRDGLLGRKENIPKNKGSVLTLWYSILRNTQNTRRQASSTKH